MHGLTSDINYQTTTGSALVDDKFSYDGNLRSTGTTATWQSGSGSTGTVFSNVRTFDPVGNVSSVITTHAAVAGQSSSGGNETQVFCYDEENRLVWAGNNGSVPAAGNGTCGSGTLSNSLQSANYSTSYAYTHLGQLWQGPLNGKGTNQQYLYCTSSQPHQVSGLYPIGTTCSNKTGATYSASYDSWGNETTRSYNSSNATLSFDVLDELTQWNAGSTNQGWYAYDNTKSRVLQRSTTSSGTTITVYAFGSEEHVYSASGAKLSDTYYYMLGGRLLGQYNGVTTQFYLTDALGSVVSTFEDVAGSAVILGNQAYGPYGNKIYSAGSMGTNKGYTGQYQDVTGLDYYNARYYDSVIGRFVSADSVQGNTKGMDPYDYVGGNPETATDPTGQRSVGCDQTEGGCSSVGVPTGGDSFPGPVGCAATRDCYESGPESPVGSVCAGGGCTAIITQQNPSNQGGSVPCEQCVSTAGKVANASTSVAKAYVAKAVNNDKVAAKSLVEALNALGIPVTGEGADAYIFSRFNILDTNSGEFYNRLKKIIGESGVDKIYKTLDFAGHTLNGVFSFIDALQNWDSLSSVDRIGDIAGIASGLTGVLSAILSATTDVETAGFDFASEFFNYISVAALAIDIGNAIGLQLEAQLNQSGDNKNGDNGNRGGLPPMPPFSPAIAGMLIPSDQ